MRLAIVESPFAGKTDAETARNVDYARVCLRDCLLRGEAPFASHLLYAQPGVLDDKIPEERRLGIEAGLSWAAAAQALWHAAQVGLGEEFLTEALQEPVRAVYTDLGVSPGMQLGIEHAERIGQLVERRELGATWFDSEIAKTWAVRIAADDLLRMLQETAP